MNGYRFMHYYICFNYRSNQKQLSQGTGGERRMLNAAGDTISTVDNIQYNGGISSLLWRIFSSVERSTVRWKDKISTVEIYNKYCEGCSVATVGNISSLLWSQILDY